MGTEVKKVYTGYKPRHIQEWLHANVKRFNVLVLHRRAGKTVFSINDMIDRAFRNKRRNPRYAYIAPTYGQAKRVAWDILKDALRSVPGCKINESELRVDIQRDNDSIRFSLLGSENPDSIRGIYLDGCILDEYAQCAPEIWGQVIRPALSDRKGWATFIGTPKGSNHFQKMYMSAKKMMAEDNEEWFAAMFKASDTGILPHSELEAAKLTMSPEEYRQEFECDFGAALVGAYYGHIMNRLTQEKKITNVPYDRAAMVDTAWDLGMDDSTAIWFIQRVGREYHAIEYFECHGKGLPEIVKELQNRPYIYGAHFLPHDAKARELGTGVSRVETLKKLGLKNLEVVRKLGVEDGINATRLILPNFWFNEHACDYGIECLKSYEREYVSKDQVFKARPKHNWASHGADAMRTYAVGNAVESTKANRKDLPTQLDTDYDMEAL